MLPKINQQLFIQVASLDEEEEKQLYKSRIADTDAELFFIEVPIHEHNGKLKRLYQGDSLSIHYITEGGVKNYFHSEVVGIRDDNIRLIAIKKPDPDTITKVQRRNFLRVPAELEVAVKVTDQVQFVAVTEDISGGGLSFICGDKFPLQQHFHLTGWILIHFRNGSIEHAQFKGEIVRVKKLESGRQLGMVRFTDINEVERQKIMRYCFERQLDFRKN